MFVTNDKQRGGLLVAVITGGRPQLSQRPTGRFLQGLRDAGVSDVVWVVSEKDAPAYEHDDNDLAVYPMEWAEKYATEHWMQPTPYEPGTFFGAFVGREWACVEAERRGCWGVLQLDDNIQKVSIVNDTPNGFEIDRRHGELAGVMDSLAAVTLSTNGHMVGAQLSAVGTIDKKLSRPGFPYSCFIEKVGEGRENWYGPFEDDITHALQYGTRADNSTALVVGHWKYCKEFNSKSGMRKKYNNERAVQLQRIFPESAELVIQTAKSNGVKGDGKANARVFHKLRRGAIRNPQVVLDKDLYCRWASFMRDEVKEYAGLFKEMNREKSRRRIDKAQPDREAMG